MESEQGFEDRNHEALACIEHERQPDSRPRAENVKESVPIQAPSGDPIIPNLE